MITWKIERNDVIEWAKNYNGQPFHAALLDPPYHLVSINKRFSKPGSKPPKGGVYKRTSAGFMLSEWDGLGESGKGIAFDPATWDALAEHLYPGAFIMAFAGSRGYHRMACAMEDAGLIIHPAMGWLTLSGFPKATRIDTQLDKAAGVQQEIIGKGTSGEALKHSGENPRPWHENYKNDKGRIEYDITAPATPLARDWAGHRYGLQALKPAFEFIAVAQVPYEGRPVDSIVATGAGALNIAQSRIGTDSVVSRKGLGQNRLLNDDGWIGIGHRPDPETNTGRWPSNFILSHSPLDNGECHPDCPVRLFDEQAGESTSTGGVNTGGLGDRVYGKYAKDMIPESAGGYGDSGPASRMFFQADFSYEVAEQPFNFVQDALANADPVRYEPKVSSSEREAGLDGFEVMAPHAAYGEFKGTPEHATNMNGKMRNNHPTLKPVSLTKYLATLLLPPAAYAPRRILVPFCGVASEMAGCVLAGWESVTGIESNAAYVEIARARLAWWSQWPGWGQTDVDAILAAAKGDNTGQMSLFATLDDEVARRGQSASPRGTAKGL